jgi:hypothetical protein
MLIPLDHASTHGPIASCGHHIDTAQSGKAAKAAASKSRKEEEERFVYVCGRKKKKGKKHA